MAVTAVVDFLVCKGLRETVPAEPPVRTKNCINHDRREARSQRVADGGLSVATQRWRAYS
jgi:hypothetical protein